MNDAPANHTHGGNGLAPCFTFWPSRAIQCASTQDHERTEPVHVVEPDVGSIPEEQQDDAEERLHAGHQLRHREPDPEPRCRDRVSGGST